MSWELRIRPDFQQIVEQKTEIWAYIYIRCFCLGRFKSRVDNVFWRECDLHEVKWDLRWHCPCTTNDSAKRSFINNKLRST